jgi:hypothetical protein
MGNVVAKVAAADAESLSVGRRWGRQDHNALEVLEYPRSRSSRVMVASAWKVCQYWTFGTVFWKR